MEIIQVKAYFQLLIPGATSVSLLENEFGFKIVKLLVVTVKRPSSLP
jgi:hypothetical protein